MGLGGADRHVGHEVSAKLLLTFGSNVTTGLPYRMGKTPEAEGLPTLFGRTDSGMQWVVLGLIGLGLVGLALRRRSL